MKTLSPWICATSLVAAFACGGKSDDKPAGGKPPGDKPVAGSGSAGSAGSASAATKKPTAAPARGPERSVYSLVDNRLAAHLSRAGGLVLSGGSNGFVKYTKFGKTTAKDPRSWSVRESQGDAKVARLRGTSGKVDVPLTSAQAGSAVVRMRVFSDKPAARAMSLRVNGNQSKEIQIQQQPGWSVVEFPVAGMLREGENELLFFVGGGAGLDVAWLQVGGSAAPADDALGFYQREPAALTIPDQGGMSWYVMVPEGGRLTGDLDDGACNVAVTATGEDGTVVDGALTGTGAAVDLASLAGKVARIDLVAGGCPMARLAKAALVVPGDAPAVKRGPAPKYVLMIIMDSLRADRVPAFNSKARPEAPMFDELAKTGAVFTQNYVQGNESRVSHASIWSSLYPIKHRMIGEKEQIDGKWTTIDEVAKAAGKFVAGVSGNGYIRPKRGFGSGWDKFQNRIEEEVSLKGEDLFKKGLEFVEGKTDPWFLYIGTIDTHVSWRAKAPWIGKYSPGYSGRFADTFSGEDAGQVASGKIKMSDAEIKHVRAIYDSNVSYQDQILRETIDKLKAEGKWDSTMVIITADHGDEQWEDGRVGHGASTRDMLIHVPLLIHYPPMIGAGTFTEGTEVVDIVPTLAEVLGQPFDPEWQGESLVSLSQGVGRGYPRMSFNSMYEDAFAARLGHWKIRVPGGGTTRAYNLATDPDEMKDIGGTPAAAFGTRALLDGFWLFRQFNLEWKKSVWGNPANVSARLATDLGE